MMVVGQPLQLNFFVQLCPIYRDFPNPTNIAERYPSPYGIGDRLRETIPFLLSRNEELFWVAYITPNTILS